jgi:hypothetical protein
VVVGILLAILFLGGMGWFLQKYNVNIGLISIGVDFFQTLAIASNANVPWPQELKNLFLIFSAFNLNIEIVAPECFIKSVTFVSKFQAIIAIPLLLYFTFFCLAGTSFLYRRYVMGQRDWRLLMQDAPPMFSGGLLMLYLWYLYVAKTTMNIFTCVPSAPPDGNVYLIDGGVATGPCGKPGSAQVQLLPVAIFALLLYVVGFPLIVAGLLWKFKEKIMEDQYLLAVGMGWDRLSNPNALVVRNSIGRLYNLFKPTCVPTLAPPPPPAALPRRCAP